MELQFEIGASTRMRRSKVTTIITIDQEDLNDVQEAEWVEIGRASCRERV